MRLQALTTTHKCVYCVYKFRSCPLTGHPQSPQSTATTVTPPPPRHMTARREESPYQPCRRAAAATDSVMADVLPSHTASDDKQAARSV